jgi:hypothetical protein
VPNLKKCQKMEKVPKWGKNGKMKKECQMDRKMMVLHSWWRWKYE